MSNWHGDSSGRFNPIAAALVFAGAVAIVLALTVASWLPKGAGRLTAPDIDRALTASAIIASTPGVDDAYFSWLAWGLFAFGVVAGILAACPFSSAASATLRILAFMIGCAGALFSLAALIMIFRFAQSLEIEPGDKQIHVRGLDVIKHAGLGMWLAVSGFMLIGIGGVIGPLHRSE